MNRIIVVGNAGKDPVLETVQKKDGGVVQKMEISVADSTRRDDAATWYRITMWGNRGERLSQMIKKGMKLTVIGRLEVSEYLSKTGEKRTDLTVHADEIEFTNPQHSQPMGGQQPIHQTPVIDTPPVAPGAPGPDINKEIPF